ncbi:MAG TPA: hypothetical protein VG318_13505 [Actinomycetota bacterium]|nr:hypothetical protein [Actinomycetota bacterium]
MGGRVRALNDDDAEVVPLGVEKQEGPPPPPRAHSTLHTLAISGMSLSALVGICVLFLSIGIGLPDGGRRASIAIVVGAAVVFLACASTAVFTAARETYPVRGSGDGAPD